MALSARERVLALVKATATVSVAEIRAALKDIAPLGIVLR
jgi:hypothetical protein